MSYWDDPAREVVLRQLRARRLSHTLIAAKLSKQFGPISRCAVGSKLTRMDLETIAFVKPSKPKAEAKWKIPFKVQPGNYHLMQDVWMKYARAYGVLPKPEQEAA